MAWSKQASAVVGIFASLSLCIVAFRQWWRRREEAAAAERKTSLLASDSTTAEEIKSGPAHAAETTPSEAASEACVLVEQPYIDDPRPGKAGKCRVRAFSSIGHETACDRLCQVPFLGNQFEVPGGLRFHTSSSSSSGSNEEFVFRDSVAALHALKFWEHAKQFENLTGPEAIKKEVQLLHSADLSYSGFGSSCEAMKAILKAKFVVGSEMAARLRSTADDFLLEHRSDDRSTADDCLLEYGSDDSTCCSNGEAQNWLGLQLMILRDVLVGRSHEPDSWTSCFYDEQAESQTLSGRAAWQAAVQSANDALRPLLSLVCTIDGAQQQASTEVVSKRSLKTHADEAETSAEVERLPRPSSSKSSWVGAAEVSRLTQCALDEAASHFDNDTSRWVVSGIEDDVRLSSLSLPGTRLPMFRGILELPAAHAPYFDDVAQVVLSHAGRRFWDQMFESAVVLARCDANAALQCEFRKPSPVNNASVGVGAFGVRRNAVRVDSVGVNERMTVALTAIPEHLVAPFNERIEELSSGSVVRADAKLWSVDVLLRGDGSMRVGFLLHTDLSTVKLPAFLLRKILASVPAVPVKQIVLMASNGMTPRHTVALAGPEPEETEKRDINGRCLRVSTLFRGVFLDRRSTRSGV